MNLHLPEDSIQACLILPLYAFCICGKKAMRTIREEHLLSAKFHCQITGRIWMSVMDPQNKR